MEDHTAPANQELRTQVKALAESSGWPQLRLNHFWPSLMGRVLTGFVVGNGILLLLTRGNFEGHWRLLRGEGGGVGVIIVVVTTVIGTVAGLVSALKTTSGEKQWNEWLTPQFLGDDALLRAKNLLEQ